MPLHPTRLRLFLLHQFPPSYGNVLQRNRLLLSSQRRLLAQRRFRLLSGHDPFHPTQRRLRRDGGGPVKHRQIANLLFDVLLHRDRVLVVAFFGLRLIDQIRAEDEGKGATGFGGAACRCPLRRQCRCPARRLCPLSGGSRCRGSPISEFCVLKCRRIRSRAQKYASRWKIRKKLDKKWKTFLKKNLLRCVTYSEEMKTLHQQSEPSVV